MRWTRDGAVLGVGLKGVGASRERDARNDGKERRRDGGWATVEGLAGEKRAREGRKRGRETWNWGTVLSMHSGETVLAHSLSLFYFLFLFIVVLVRRSVLALSGLGTIHPRLCSAPNQPFSELHPNTVPYYQ